MRRFTVVQSFVIDKTWYVEAETEEAACDIVNGTNPPEPDLETEPMFNRESVAWDEEE